MTWGRGQPRRKPSRADEARLIVTIGVLGLSVLVYHIGGGGAVTLFAFAVAGTLALHLSTKKRYRGLRKPAVIWLTLCGIGALGYATYLTGHPAVGVAAAVTTTAVAYYATRYARRRVGAKYLIKDKGDALIAQALKIMDSVHTSYRDEDEANRELVVTLKALCPEAAQDIQYLGGSSYGDVKMGNNIIIEGKLDLVGKHETDRLIGQIQDCCGRRRKRVKVVVYGELATESGNRIKSLQWYPEKVSLIALRRPTRIRQQRWYYR